MFVLTTVLNIIWFLCFLQKSIDEAKEQVKKEIAEVEEKCSKLKDVMGDLKTQLYAKFGTHINLEAEEE